MDSCVDSSVENVGMMKFLLKKILFFEVENLKLIA